MGATAPAAVAMVDGRKVLRLACNFADTKIERASWDRAVKLDLASARGVEFKLRCAEASPVSSFSIYFQSGEGWYHATFYPESSTDWNTIKIDKTETTVEGKPAGWGQIKTIRLSAWRGQDANTEFFLSDIRPIGLLGADAAVAILRAESAAQRSPEERRSVEQSAEAVARQFQALGIGCALISDLDVSAARLKQARLVVLPHNPSMPDRAADELIAYLNSGGKLLAFYAVPERLWPVLRIESARHVPAPYAGYFSAIRLKEGALPGAPPLVGQQSWNISAVQPVPGQGRVLGEWLDQQGQPTGHAAVVATTNCLVMTHVLLPDDAANKRRLLLAMAGFLAPELWRQAAEAEIGRIGTIGGFKTYSQAVEQIARLNPSRAEVAAALADAAQLRQSALRLAAQQKFAQAIEASAAASQRVKEAFCLAQQPLAGEFRAFWCHSAFGVQGLDWDEAVQRLAQNGFTAILPNLLWGGAAFYPSQVLPVAPAVTNRGDQVAQCLAACRKHGLQMHVWKVNWNLGSAAPQQFIGRLRREGRLQADSQGKEERWLCPSHPENQKLELDSLIELARNYDVDGLHFDYIRYPDADHCFCAGCKARFERSLGATAQDWPKDVLAGGPFRRQWLDWRRANITAVVKAVSQQARAIRPKIKLSAAVFPNWPVDRDGVGQDWRLWCEKGYVDFVCPMDYTPSSRSFENMVARQVQWAGRTPCYPGIGVSASSSHFGVDRLIEQINVTRRHGTGGFVIFNYGVPESNELLPLLGLGITAKRK
ncbi:MAG: family 10 glycosylhydrolase [Verrucomicrobiota bacterium]|jgi:uncharacterized lipoprotein YddW (UPF0748 family)